MNIFRRFIKKVMVRFYRVKNYLSPSHGPANAVFIWIPKNAGTSTFDVLRREAGFLKLKRMPELTSHFKQKGRVSFAHIDYQALRSNGHVSDEFDQTAFKFCFVRDPYERVVSLYHYFLKDERIGGNTTFLEFCQLLKNTEIEPIGLYNYSGLSQCNPQVRWLDGMKMDFVGRYEDLEADFTRLAKEFSVVATLPNLNRARFYRLNEYYCAESKAIVEDYYREDFVAFDYKIREIK
ncbi:sulfotransferase family 2 domain-containing protein [Oceanicoccus sagamiensis]|uniref:Sulfotransferase family protein n=1 Tax=Oceanicoccus sagamiensis TaxID=716816 RepID=A0A1X9N9N4_9GAMM|nr:sulfotransferase family 2 domain-containing protein [Oceanicoccus sagamiensis]ARN73891.1 hypothetical protein BST96_07045 [Oceanicoccus sagamiensis]